MTTRARAERPKRPRDQAARRPPRVRLEVDARRAQLLELGLHHFGTRAEGDVSIDEIAHAAGISKGLLYHYFPTKRAFYIACVREAAAHLLAMTDLRDDEAPPLDRLTKGIDTYLAYVRAHGRVYATLMRGASVDPEIAGIVDRTRTTLLDRLTRGVAPTVPLESPLVQIALRAWIGLAETASLVWVERCVEADAPSYEGPPVPSAAEIRDLLASALLAILERRGKSHDARAGS